MCYRYIGPKMPNKGGQQNQKPDNKHEKKPLNPTARSGNATNFHAIRQHAISTSTGANVLNVSLIISNAQYLKTVLDKDEYKVKHYVELVSLSVSLTLQLVLGILISYKHREKYINKKNKSTQHESSEKEESWIPTKTLDSSRSRLVLLLLFSFSILL